MSVSFPAAATLCSCADPRHPNRGSREPRTNAQPVSFPARLTLWSRARPATSKQGSRESRTNAQVRGVRSSHADADRAPVAGGPALRRGGVRPEHDRPAGRGRALSAARLEAADPAARVLAGGARPRARWWRARGSAGGRDTSDASATTTTGGAGGRALPTRGVDVSACRVAPDTRNGMSVILVDEGTGERTVLWTRDAGLKLRPDDVDPAAVCAGRVLLVDCHETASGTAAARAARRAGVRTVVDVEHVRDGIDALLAEIDVIVTAQEGPGCADRHGRTGSGAAGDTGRLPPGPGLHDAGLGRQPGPRRRRRGEDAGVPGAGRRHHRRRRCLPRRLHRGMAARRRRRGGRAGAAVRERGGGPQVPGPGAPARRVRRPTRSTACSPVRRADRRTRRPRQPAEARTPRPRFWSGSLWKSRRRSPDRPGPTP